MKMNWEANLLVQWARTDESLKAQSDHEKQSLNNKVWDFVARGFAQPDIYTQCCCTRYKML